VTLIGSMSDIQTFLAIDGNLRYSVVNDVWLKVSLTSARLATTTDGVKFTTAVYTAESVEAVRLVASVATATGTNPAMVAVNDVETVTPHEPAAADVKLASNSESNSITGNAYRVVTASSLPVGQWFAVRKGQGAAAVVSRSLSVVGGESPVSFTSVESLNLEELQTSKKAGMRLNRSVRGVKGVLV
jgi:hypothetical protein